MIMHIKAEKYNASKKRQPLGLLSMTFWPAKKSDVLISTNFQDPYAPWTAPRAWFSRWQITRAPSEARD